MVVINSWTEVNKMKILLISLFIFVSVHGRLEEIDPYLKDLLKDPELFKLISKRLGAEERILQENEKDDVPDAENPESKKPVPTKRTNINKDDFLPKEKTNGSPCRLQPNGYSSIGDSEGNSCRYKAKRNAIIRSNESVQAGALFLRRIENIADQCSCTKKCCYIQGCTLAVFENKNNHSCYLFNCQKPSKCVFAEHKNYASMMLSSDSEDVSDVHSHVSSLDHEGQLMGLGKATTKKPVPTTTPMPKKIPVALHAECDVDKGDHCVDKNSACISGRCTCTENYQDKLRAGICKARCGADEFDCRTSAGCIPKNQLCDGQNQCADGSDENNCPQKDDYDKENSETDPKGTPQEPGLEKLEKTVKPVTKQPATEAPVVTPTPSPKKEEIATASPVKSDMDAGIPDSKEIKSSTNETTVSSQESKVPINKTMNHSATKPGKHNSTKTQHQSEGHSVQISEDETGLVIVKSYDDGSKGPIVALSLGLAITLMLLVFVGCRLRNVKRRIRKGRALHSNEADYLINGMYL